MKLPPHTVTLTAGESEADRFTFTLNSTDATAVAYVVLDEGEAIPERALPSSTSLNPVMLS